MKPEENWEQELMELSAPAQGDDTAAQKDAEREFERKLQKAIDRRIRKICVKTTAVVLAALMVVFLGISPLMDALCESPEKLRQSGVSLTHYLHAYYESVQPYTEIIGGMGMESVEKRGFGRYTVRFDVVDQTGGVVIGRGNTAAEFAYGAYRITDEPEDTVESLSSALLNRFNALNYNEEETIENFRDLPASGNLFLSVTLKDPISVQSLREDEKITAKWVQIESDSTWQGGLLLHSTTSFDGAWRQEMDGEELRQAYLDNLQCLLSEPKLLADLTFYVSYAEDHGKEYYSGSILFAGQEVVQETYDAVAAQTGELMTRCFCIAGGRDEVIDFLERMDVTSLQIDKITLY